MTYPGPMDDPLRRKPPRPTLQDRLDELAAVESSYRGNNAQYARLIRNTVSVAELAVRTAIADLDAAVADHETTIAALEAAHDRALARKDAELARWKAGSTLAEMRAVPEDDDSLVRVTFSPPTSGWRTEHLQDIYARLREAGSDDRDVLDIASSRDGVPRIAGLVTNADVVRLTFPEPNPAPPGRLVTAGDGAPLEPPDPWITHDRIAKVPGWMFGVAPVALVLVVFAVLGVFELIGLIG